MKIIPMEKFIKLKLRMREEISKKYFTLKTYLMNGNKNSISSINYEDISNITKLMTEYLRKKLGVY